MTLQALLDELLRRLHAIDTGELLISDNEAQAWPEGALVTLQKAGLLVATNPARSLICPGCEEACTMPVQVVPGSHPRAYIVCDRRNDVGRVPIDLADLARWQITNVALVRILSSACGADEAQENAIQARLRNTVLSDLFRVQGQ